MDRAFIVGSESVPEKLRTAYDMSFERTGQGLAEKCRDNAYTTGDHALLARSRQEIDRMDPSIKAILFPTDLQPAP
jgi:hypothetical protein